MNKWLLCLLLISAPAFAQYSTIVTGNVRSISPNLPPGVVGSYVEFALVNCGLNTPMVNGVAVLTSGPVDFYADANGGITTAANGGVPPTLFGNDAILCGASYTSRYSVRYFVGGIAQGPAKFYYVASNVPFNLSTARPITLLPPLVYPNTTTCPPGSYSAGINNDLSVKCLNLPTGASNAVVTDPTATQEIANQPTIFDGSVSAQSVNGVVNAAAYSSLNVAAAACPLSGHCTIEINGAVGLTSNLTLTGFTTLHFNQPGILNLNSFQLTSSSIDATPYQIFSGGAVRFGAQIHDPPVEWFGAIGDWNGTTGTDNTASFQACLSALIVGQCKLLGLSYKVSGALTINKSSVGIAGVGTRINVLALYPNPAASTIISTNPSADIIDVVGGSSSNNVAFNKFNDFSLERSVLPVSTAAGLSLNFTYGASVERVTSVDSIRDIYVHGSGSQGNGYIADSVVAWGYNGLTETSGSLYGIYLDSSDGLVSNNSFRVRHSFAAANGIGATTFGVELTGSALNDQMFDGFETAGVTYGEDIHQTALGGAGTASDIHFNNTINDGCGISCFRITGLTATGSAYVEINGGYNNTATFNPAIDIESSSGVRVIGTQVGLYNGASAYSACVDVNNSSNISIIGILCQGARNVGILLNASSAISLTGNTLIGNADSNGLITLTGSGLNAIYGNTMSGTGASIIVDSASNNNTGLYSNTIQAGLTAGVNAGSNPLSVADALHGTTYNLDTGGQWRSGSGAPTGACSNGSWYGNTGTATGTFPNYQCRNSVWAGLGTVY